MEKGINHLIAASKDLTAVKSVDTSRPSTTSSITVKSTSTARSAASIPLASQATTAFKPTVKTTTVAATPTEPGRTIVSVDSAPPVLIQSDPAAAVISAIMDQKVDAILPSPDTLPAPLGVSEKVYMQQDTAADPIKTALGSKLSGAQKLGGVVAPEELKEVLTQAKESGNVLGVEQKKNLTASFLPSNPLIMVAMVVGVIALYFFSKKKG